MSKAANPTLVGTFVLAAIALAVATIITLSSIGLKDNRYRCVAFFTGSLHGLDIGAPVTFRGVAIGRVGSIRIDFNRKESNYTIPVFIDIDLQRNTDQDGPTTGWSRDTIGDGLETLIRQGLRAQLKMSSILTGKLFIELAMHPGSEVRQSGLIADTLEIPTLPSGLEQIARTLESLPLTEILNKTATALDGINGLVSSPRTVELLDALPATLAHLDTLIAHVDNEVPALAGEFRRGMAAYIQLAESVSGLLRRADMQLTPLGTETERLLHALTQAAAAITRTAANIEQLTAGDADLLYQVSSSLREFEKATHAVRQLADLLQLHPNALVFGQKEDTP